MFPEPEKVHLDNPLEYERLPPEPLTFEFVAETEEGEVITRIPFTFLIVALFAFGLASLSHVLSAWQPSISSSLPLPVTILGLLICVLWVFNRQEMASKASPVWGLLVASLLFLLTLLAPIQSNLIHLTTAILFLYATGELAIHWSILKKRGFDPVIDSDRQKKPHMEKELDYAELMVPASFGALAIATYHLIPAGEVLLVVLALAIWSITLEKSSRRKTPPHKLLWYTVRKAYLYPDAEQTAFGLVKTPMVNRTFRAVPTALFTACSAYSAIMLGTYVGSLSALILLLGIWTLIATEFVYDY